MWVYSSAMNPRRTRRSVRLGGSQRWPRATRSDCLALQREELSLGPPFGGLGAAVWAGDGGVVAFGMLWSLVVAVGARVVDAAASRVWVVAAALGGFRLAGGGCSAAGGMARSRPRMVRSS